MMQNKDKLILFSRILLFVIYFVGLTGISIPSLREVYAEITPVTLLISAMILLVFHKSWRVKDGIVFLMIALGGFLVELLGVQTGLIFGEYSYGLTLGPAVMGVPLLIGINWLILSYTTYYLAGHLFKRPVGKIPLAAAMMVAFDWLMEPVAIKLDMWQWTGEAIPLMNYAAWFVVSLLFAAVLHFSRIRMYNPVAGYLLLFMAMFFGVLNLTL
jgi:putative membrane protein